jgi:hypothetical protein
MIVTIHQPNFAPWTGFFDKMARADVFVLLDTVPFTKGGFQNRVKIKGHNGAQWLTVPVVTSGRLGQATNEVETNEKLPWRRDHLRTLEGLYGKTPHGARVLEILGTAYESPSTVLADLCVSIIERVKSEYAITTKLVRSSELGASGSSSELLAAIVAECGGDTYLSGPSGRSYLEGSPFDERGIAVTFHSFTPTPYPQVHGEFVGGLSMLDHLANVGPLPWWT